MAKYRSSHRAPRRRLIRALKRRPLEHRRYLAQRKRDARKLRSRPDLIWHLLLQSAATLGNSRGWHGFRDDPNTLKSVSYSAIRNRSPGSREACLLKALRKTKVRMPTIKAPWLARNFALLEQMGGVRLATRKMLKLRSYDEKLAFVRMFHGIGEKYGRNVWMDIYDPGFRNRIAVDNRLKRIARAIGFTGSRYCESEALFQAIASDAELEPWELDRLLYGFTDYYVQAALGTRPRKT